jgi:excinuclease UvrABC nuclease subunit
VLELDCGLAFDPEQDQGFFGGLPARPAVCLVEARAQGAEPFLIRTQNLRSRLERLLGPADSAGKRLNLRQIAAGIRYRLTGSKLEQTFCYYQHARLLFPRTYRKLMRLRPPAVLKLNLQNAYPRCFVTRRISVNADGEPTGGVYYGPYPTRKAAEAFAGQALDFFKVRRCQIKIRRDPSFPGCLYSEMKMCLAPCFAGCTKEDYDNEVERLARFLESSGESLLAAYEAERDLASEQLDFEKAAALHKRIDKLRDTLRTSPELARRIQDLDAVVLQRAAEEQSIAAFIVRRGRIAEPFFVRFAELASQPRSVEHFFRERLEGEPPPPSGELGEQLALLARWYYSSPREGEILFREKDWPYRRILRACSRLLAPAEEAKSAGDPAKRALSDSARPSK